MVGAVLSRIYCLIFVSGQVRVMILRLLDFFEFLDPCRLLNDQEDVRRPVLLVNFNFFDFLKFIELADLPL